MNCEYNSIDVYNFASNGNIDELIIALNDSKYTNWYIDDEGNTALHKAAINCHENIIEILLDRCNEIDIINKKNYSGMTVLHIVANNCNEKLVKLLLERNVTVDDNNIDKYAPIIKIDNNIQFIDCRPLILNRNNDNIIDIIDINDITITDNPDKLINQSHRSSLRRIDSIEERASYFFYLSLSLSLHY